ncbi:hypothetical protein JHK84_055383 [Glycine max]|nr:hypothetical protein JHK84_055383 [Glycine max]
MPHKSSIEDIYVSKNECKKKRRDGWCTSKKKNIDAAWEVTGESGHSSVHHHIRPQDSVNDTRYGLGSLRRRAAALRDG